MGKRKICLLLMATIITFANGKVIVNAEPTIEEKREAYKMAVEEVEKYRAITRCGDMRLPDD